MQILLIFIILYMSGEVKNSQEFAQETKINEHYISYNTTKTNLEINQCSTTGDNYYFSKKVTKKCGQKPKLPSGKEKTKNSRKKRSKTIDGQGELSRAKLLHNIVDKIREVKNKKQQDIQLSAQKSKLSKFEELEFMVYESLKEKDRQSGFKDSSTSSNAFVKEIEGIEKIKQNEIARQSYSFFSNLNEEKQESTSNKRSTPLLLSFTNTISTDKGIAPPIAHADKNSSRGSSIHSNLSKPQRILPRSRSNSQTKITFTYASPSPNNKMENYISPPKKMIPMKLTFKPKLQPKQNNYYFKGQEIHHIKKQIPGSCSYCGRSCQCFNSLSECRACGRRCNCPQRSKIK